MYYFRLSFCNNGKMAIDTNLNEYNVGKYTAYIYGNLNDSDMNAEEFAKRNHGVVLCLENDKLELLNDPFCSLPLYIYVSDAGLIIDSRFESFKSEKLHLDVVGCYENLMYSSGLFDRTPFCEIKQMPAASKLIYSCEDKRPSIAPFWDYNIPCEVENDEETAVSKVMETLSDIYSRYSKMDTVMGVSGGLDSRLSLLLLKTISGASSIKTFTFGHNKNIKDYSIARKVCKELGVDEPEFHRINSNTYKKAAVIPMKTAGGVGINHGHIYDVISGKKYQGYTLISNYFSDGVMGYDCRPSDTDDYKQCEYYEVLQKNRYNAPKNVLDEIENDLLRIVLRRGKNDNYSGYNEYIYLTERNPKFHMKLSYLYSEEINVEMPFAEYALLESVISLPVSFRYYKRIEQLILESKFLQMDDISSTRYAGMDEQETSFKKKIHFNIGYLLMRSVNLMNSGLKLLSNGYLQIPNPYITENYLSVFDRSFSKEKEKANRILVETLDLKMERNPLTRNNIRTEDATLGFDMLSLATLIDQMMMLD